MGNIGLISIRVVQLTDFFLFLSLTTRSLFENETSQLNFGPLARSSILRKQNALFINLIYRWIDLIRVLIW